MTDANRISAEYLMRRVETVDWQAHEDAVDLARERQFTVRYGQHLMRPTPQDSSQYDKSRTSPLEAVAGFAVLGLVFVLIFWGL